MAIALADNATHRRFLLALSIGLSILMPVTATKSRELAGVPHGLATVTQVSDGSPRARDTKSCIWTSAGGLSFDLSPLMRTGSDEDYSVNIAHSNFAMLVNLCANTLRVPHRCTGRSNTRASVGFQWDTSNDNSCWELGSLETIQWSLLDERLPRKGVELMFTGGTPCSVGARMVHFHMICAESVGSEGPSFAWEAPTCSYHVVWPTVHACPRDAGSPWLTWIFISLACIFGFVVVSAWGRSQDSGQLLSESLLDIVVQMLEASKLASTAISSALMAFFYGLCESINSKFRSKDTTSDRMRGNMNTFHKPYRDAESGSSSLEEDDTGQDVTEKGSSGRVVGESIAGDPFMDGEEELEPMTIAGDSI